MMVFMSLVPAGVYQAYHSMTTGFWYARSEEIVRGPVMEVPGLAARAGRCGLRCRRLPSGLGRLPRLEADHARTPA
jgi:hypothetical protein